MSVSAADVAALRAMPTNDYTSDPLLPLTSVEQVLAFTAAQARAEGRNEADAVELIVRAAGESPASVRHSATVLRQLGYHLVADRLRSIAGRRYCTLKPIP